MISNISAKPATNIAPIILCITLLVSTVTKLNAQCKGADIIENRNGNCLPALVRYVVSPAFPPGTNYYWDAGDNKGAILGGDTLYHEYTSGGSYGISVNIILPDGNKCTITKDTGFLVLSAATSLGFYADQTLLCTLPAVLNLHDTTGNTTGRDWYINGSLYTDHSKDIAVNTNTPGNVSITLVVYTKSECPQLVAKTNYIQVFGLNANFCSVLTENPGHNKITANFTPGFDTTGNKITEMDWKFPGGNPASYHGYSPPPVIYTDLSTPQSVSLTINTKTGCTTTFTKDDLVRKYYSVTDSNDCQQDSARLRYIDTNAPGQILGFNYIGSNLGMSYKKENALNYGIKFAAPGIADMKFGISYTSSNCTDTLIVPALFNILPDVADFGSIDRNQCQIPAVVHLHALYGSPVSGTTYNWKFFDSTMSEIPGSTIGPIKATDTSFSFMQNGLYSIRLITTNANGCTDTITKINYARIGTPDNNFKLPVDTICENKSLSIKNLSTTIDDPNNPLGYNWIFQNQYIPFNSVHADVRSPNITFSQPGMYDLTYTITSYSGLCPSVIKIKNAIFVEGVSVNIIVSGNNGCVPIEQKLTADILANFPNVPLSYSWSIQPSDGVIIQNPSGISTNVTFNNPGCYTATLTVTTLNGCVEVKTADNLVCVGTIAGFAIPSIGCLNVPVTINNTSSLNPNQFKWSINPTNGITINSDVSNTPEIKIIKPGCYTIQLTTSHSSVSNCFDTVSHQICANAPPEIISVNSPDTSSRCAPREDQFFATGINAATFYWDFGDGITITTKDSQPKHVYLKNNNAGYTVKVIAFDKNGCPSDSVILKNYIKIAGPEPDFIVSSKPSCNSGLANFINRSRYVTKYYFVFGDNSGVDSNQIKPHFYKFMDYSKDSNIYTPTMFAYDESGCVAIETGTIILYRPPLVSFSVNDSNGCIPFSVHFSNTTKYAIKYAWDFGDGSSDSSFQPDHVFTQASSSGNPYNITLKAFSDKGCEADGIPAHITVNALPLMKITTSAPESICYKDVVHFSGSANVSMLQYRWNFGDGNLISDTSDYQNPTYHYKFPGRHTVSLTGISKNGCKNSASDSTSILIQDTIAPPPPSIYFVTVTASNAVEIVTKKETDPAFASEKIYRLPSLVAINNTNSNLDTIINDLPPSVKVNSQSYGYTATTTDVCGLTSLLSKPHFTILLSINKFPNGGLTLSWNKYIGWNHVSGYEIYRQNGNNKFTLLSSLSAFDSSYVDTMLCPGSYFYYVSAFYVDHKYISNSNMLTDSPDYIYPTNPVLLRKATVINNQQVEVVWDAGTIQNLKYYSIDRTEGDQGWQFDYASTDIPSFIDANTQVSKYSYHYRIKVVDRCGNAGPISNIGTTVLLKGTVNNDNRRMNWTSYKLWFNGVKNYQVQLQQGDGSFQDVALKSPQDTLYSDSLTHDDLNAPICYEVSAHQNLTIEDNASDTSVSNIVCLNLPARLFIPDAFTPNKDGLNETFKPIGLSILNGSDIVELQYDFRIYNRWGELLFETHDVKQGWDGTNKGKDLPEDVYVYIIEAHGYNSQSFYIHGSVTLLK